MSDLGPQYQNLSYQGLLQVPGGITSSLQVVQDGDGNPTGLLISSTGVSFTGLTSATAENLSNGVAGAIPYQSAASTTNFVSPGSSGYVLISNGSSAPSWSNTAPHALTSNATTNLAGGTAGTIPFQSSAGVTSYTAAGTAGQVLTSAGLGTPVWNSLTAASIGALATNGSNSMSGNINMSGNTVTNLATPVNAGDAASKGYVDSIATGLSFKTACVVATTANITLSGIQSIDGVPVGSGERVLVKNQTNAAENGIYDSSSSAWTRSSDANTWNELIGATVFITYGSTLDGTTWTSNITAGGTLGTTPVTFVQFSSSQSYTAGTGLQLIGNEFSVVSPFTATYATALQTARTINGVAFDGTTNITIPSTTSYGISFDATGTGAAPGSSFNGSSPLSVSYNTVGAASTNGSNVTAGSTWPINVSGTSSSITNTSGVVAGSYSNPNITVNAQGLITSASIGSAIYFNVRAYGASPSASASTNRAAFQAAIDAAYAANRGTVYVPAGTYAINDTLVLYDVNLLGEGHASDIAATISLSTSPIIHASGMVSVRNLQIRYASGITGSESQGQKVIIRCGDLRPSIPYGNLRNSIFDYLLLGSCGTAFYESGSNTSAAHYEAVFSTTFSNIWAYGFRYRGFDFHSVIRTGNVYQNLYLGAGDGVTCNCLFALQGIESESSIIQLNIEHSTFTQNAVIFDGCDGLGVTSMHLEAVIPSAPGRHFVSCSHSTGSFNDFTIINCDHAQTAISIFQLNSSYNNYWSLNGSAGDPPTANYYEFGVLYIGNVPTNSGCAVFSRGTDDGSMYVNIGNFEYGPSWSAWQGFPFSGNITFLNSGVNSFYGNPYKSWVGQQRFENNYFTASTGSIVTSKRSTDGAHYYFLSPTSAFAGQIYTVGATTTYATASDYRLKSEIEDITDATARIKSLIPRRFLMQGMTSKTDGFFAHEAQQVVPEAVLGEKDAVNESGEPIYQSMDQSKLIPVMVAGMQEILKRLDALENK